MESAQHIQLEKRGSLGLVTLDRPRQLNALTLDMVRAMHPQLLRWADDASIKAVAIRANGGKAFCAGGDIRALYDLKQQGRPDEARAFWREEYMLNRDIKRYPKPYVALIDGIVMGGGVGLSMHGSHRVASDTFLFAMPEVGIGFFPDVGATYLLPRLADAFGAYLAVTGARIGRGDGMAAGLATHAAPASAFEGIVAALADGQAVDAVLDAVAVAPEADQHAAQRALIAEVFSADSIGEILARLDRKAAEGSEFAVRTAATMRQKSPTSMAIALEQVRRGAEMTFEEAMRAEFRVVTRIAQGHDFYEGVRAVIVDKDNAPRWQPADVAAVDPAAIAAHFAPLPDDLTFPGDA
jgi:enoyl-CoA hydratase